MKSVKKVVEEMRVSASELSEMLDLSIARVGQLATMGVLEKGKDGFFSLSASVIGYERFLFRGAPASVGSEIAKE
jgi:hypothetical protein